MSEQLPIIEIIPAIKEKLVAVNTVILQAPPGAGKSTVLPLHLLDEPWLNGKKILMLEPRRLAARAVASRLASLLGEEVGGTVGYRVRFENRTSARTKIEVVTEGILTRMLQNDNALEDTGLVIFDEFHERSLHADLSLALCREVQQALRDDMRIMIMSATLDGAKISELLGNAPILTSKGRQHPITLNYLPQGNDINIPLQVAKAVRKAYSENEGDILVFLPGAGEIHRTTELLEQELSSSVIIYPLYGDLPQQKQQEALMPDPNGQRKIVLATSIAETSLTIEGIKVVVDSGYSRVPRFDTRTGLTKLETVKVTQDTADQRAGRAGRLGPGVCYRLWAEAQHRQLNAHRKPEILEADLAPMMLELAQWGVKDISSLAWLTLPPAGAIAQAKELLRQLDAIDDDKITARGKEMLRLPTHPRIAHLLLEGQRDNLLSLAADIAAILEERDPLNKEAGTNLTLRAEVLRKYRSKEYVSADRGSLDRIERLASNWRRIFKIQADNTHVTDEEVGKLVAAAYPERIARRTEQRLRYRLSNGRMVKLAEHDPLSHENWLAVAHLDAGTNEGRIYLAAPLSVDDVMHLAHEKREVSWDSQKGMLVARNELRIGDIIVESKPLSNITEEEKIKILCDVVSSEGESLLPWSDEVSDWQARVMSLRKWRTNEDWPDVSTGHLLSIVNEWLPPYLQNVRKRDDFQRLDLLTILQSTLPWSLQQKLDTLAPSKVEVPSGSMIRLQYSMEGNPPVLAVRLQEVFGLLDTPTMNEGRIKVLMHLLSPGYKPVQVTQDLRSFWQTTYHEVRKELRVRYQKHSWPEDPWTAEAVRGVKRRS
jgi:ATP-dependent helicase HrpB